MNERAGVLASVGYFEIGLISPARLQPVLDTMPRPEIYKRELDLQEAAVPLAIKGLAGEASDFLEQPVNTAILKRYEKDGPESGAYQPHQAPARFAGRIALVSLSGRANLFVITGPNEKTRWVSCRAGTVIYMDTVLPHWVTPPLTAEPRQMVFLGHDATKTAAS